MERRAAGAASASTGADTARPPFRPPPPSPPFGSERRPFGVWEEASARARGAEDAAELLASVVAVLEAAVASRGAAASTAPVLRTLLLAMADPVVRRTVERSGVVAEVVKALTLIPAENLIAPAQSAEMTVMLLKVLQVALLGCGAFRGHPHAALDSDAVLQALVRLYRMAAWMGHSPIVEPWLRVFAHAYDTSARARRVAVDKRLLTSLDALLSSDPPPAPAVTRAAGDLLAVMAQWLPRTAGATVLVASGDAMARLAAPKWPSSPPTARFVATAVRTARSPPAPMEPAAPLSPLSRAGALPPLSKSPLARSPLATTRTVRGGDDGAPPFPLWVAGVGGGAGDDGSPLTGRGRVGTAAVR
jgi:hypothetical protein